jgi:hypothetical protein
MKAARIALFAVLVLASSRLAGAQEIPAEQFVIVPLRVHVLMAPDIDKANCKLTDADIARVAGHINGIWNKASIHFGVESIVHEEVEQQERFRITNELGGGDTGEGEIRLLLPRASRTFDGVHVYYFHELPYNSSFVGDDTVFAREAPQLRQVKGGSDDAVARVTARALGNLLGLTGDPEPRNLMGNGTTGILLDDSQAEAARKIARTIRGVATEADVRQAAEAAEARGDATVAHRLRSWLAEVPIRAATDARRQKDNLAPGSLR